MIVDLILDAFQTAFEFVIGFFPTTTFNPVALIGSAFSHMGDLNYFIPIAELAALVVSVLVLFPAFMGGTLFMWLVAFIRGGSARG